MQKYAKWAKYTPAQTAQIARLVAEGKTVKEIADEMDIPFRSIKGKLSSMRLKAVPDVFWTKDKKNKLKMLNEEGKTVNEIAAVMGVSMPSVRSVLSNINTMRQEYQPKPRFDKMPSVRFEDMPAEVLAREPKGRMPLRSHAGYSLTGNAARMCLS